MARLQPRTRTTVGPNCSHCGKPGGRVRTDPYALDVHNMKVQVRLHDKCADQRADDI